MIRYDYKLVLTGDNETPPVDDLELSFSSISYSLNEIGTTATGAVIQGEDRSNDIADRANGNLQIYYKVSTDVTYTLLASSVLNDISISQTYNTYAITLKGQSENQTYSVSGSNIVLDILSGYSFSGGKSNFSTPQVNEYYVPGAVVEYDSVEYGIGNVAFSMSAGSSPVWTLTEGEVVTTINCTDVIESGDTKTGEISGGYCQEINNPPRTGSEWIYTKGFEILLPEYPSIVRSLSMRYYNFEVEADSEIAVTVTGTLPVMVIDALGHNGFKAYICRGNFTAFQDYTGYQNTSFDANVLTQIDLSPGVYTLVLVNIQPADHDAREFSITFSITPA